MESCSLNPNYSGPRWSLSESDTKKSMVRNSRKKPCFQIELETFSRCEGGIMSYHQTKPNYGNWIRRRILGRIGLMALLVEMLSLLPLPLVGRLILWIAGGILFLVFLYILSVYLLFADHIGNFQTQIRQVLFAHLPWDGNGKALDIGTGNGALAIGLARQYPQALVEGVDLWGAQWEYTQ